MSELESLRTEAEQLKNQIRVSNILFQPDSIIINFYKWYYFKFSK